jgi:acetate kinase
MAVATGGLDALVFTAGIGERSALARAYVCDRLDFLGVVLDPEANRGAGEDAEIAASESRVRVTVIEAREDLIAARAARELLAK